MSLSLRQYRRQQLSCNCTKTNRHRDSSPYTKPRLVCHGKLGSLVRGASWKGVDSIGELDPDQAYPG